MSSKMVGCKPTQDYLSQDYWKGTIKMSLSKFFILCVLHEAPMHGYDIARAVERKTQGCCSPSEGALYPALREFEIGGYLTFSNEIVNGRGRKVYSLTDKGRDAFRVAVSAWMEVTQWINETEQFISG
ncbi:PadR family transcriptional regulator [Serratia fonticola]|uniref:PadR family transcriptional regulator n=1 Tax=Serratia fonticola TaxID=47917 RepID=UPI00190FAE70|nr:PadR family transcriptional regulator [Serratia fonticola]MBL5862176.1 PadR family transcriptional regulator [Serratia fonticola]CAI2028614.1 lineage-specific thermal regulator protein [Serratia fonticola]